MKQNYVYYYKTLNLNSDLFPHVPVPHSTMAQETMECVHTETCGEGNMVAFYD